MTICEMLGFKFKYQKSDGIFSVTERGAEEPVFESDNPLAAWDTFVGAIDMCMRRRMRKALVKMGRNGWTGQEKGEERL